MGTAALACPGFRANGMTAGILGARLNHPPPVVTVPPPPALGAVTVGVDKEIYFVDLAILSSVALGSWIQLLILITITSKILSVCTSYSNFPC